MSYPRLIGSMLTLLRQEKVLQIRGVLALLMFASFNIFWSALVLPLSAPLASRIPRLARLDWLARWGHWRLAGQDAGPIGICSTHQRGGAVILLLAWWPLSLMDRSLGILLIGIILLDLGGQALHVTNRA
jgi:hypothetical protein